ncbi:MAG: dihydroorotase [Rhodobiaceae bacterium]|jgi:dihydroorotase|nr:dihydroorotase [Rhodobiaceae bacterium]
MTGLTSAFTNARLIDPSQKLDEIGTLLIVDNQVAAMGKGIDIPADCETIDCQGKAILPGLIDMQVFTGEPGEEHRETLATASQAAAAGGVTAMVTMPNTNPVIDDAALVDFITRRARDTAIVRVHPMAALTKGCLGVHMTEFGLLREAGAVAFTDGDRAVMNALTMRRALSYAANFNALIVQHAMDQDLQSAGVMHEGELATRLGLAGIPAAAETTMIDRDLRLVELTGGRYHISQISSAESVATIRAAKKRGVRVSCGVSATHLMLNQNDVENYRSFAKLSPPLRDEEDRLALILGVADGTIDVVVSGHNPQDAEAKRQPFAQAAYGTVGVETLLAGLLTLHHANELDLATLLACVTQRPAELLGLDGGRLAVGDAADFTLVDLGEPWIVAADALRSKSQNAAIDRRKVQGRVYATYVNGEAVFELP